jgi:hypothetical protein
VLTFEDQLLGQTLERMIARPSACVAVVGFTSAGLYIRSRLIDLFPTRQFSGVFDPEIPEGNESGVSRWTDITGTKIDIVVIAADAEKEKQYFPHLSRSPLSPRS